MPPRKRTTTPPETETETSPGPIQLPPPEAPQQIAITPIDAETLLIPILGTAPLITHRFSEKARKQMLDNMQGNRAPKESKNPEAEYQAAMYRLDDGRYGAPTLAFKQATTGAARYFGKAVSMVMLRQTLFFSGEPTKQGEILQALTGSPPHMREDVVTVGMRGHDLRYRPQFDEWGTILQITYVKSMLTKDSVLSLVDAGGMGVGIGEWRPERSGQFGTYRIDPTLDVEVLR